MRRPQHGEQTAVADPVEAYQRAVNASFVPLRISAARGGRFSGSIASVPAGDAVFSEVTSSPQEVERTPQAISAGGRGYYKVSLLLSGAGQLVQDGREISMTPGDLAFYDTSRPYSLAFDRAFRNVIMMFPKYLVEVPQRTSESLTAVSLRAEHSLAGLVSGFLTQATPQLGQLQGYARSRLARTGVDLMNTLLSAILGDRGRSGESEGTGAGAGASEQLQRVLRYMADELASPELTPQSIAAANFLSVRHLHTLFEATGTTVSRWIRERRLERCRDDLRDPALAHLPIAAIAARWGFRDAGHFSRAFRAEFAESPRECRTAR